MRSKYLGEKYYENKARELVNVALETGMRAETGNSTPHRSSVEAHSPRESDRGGGQSGPPPTSAMVGAMNAAAAEAVRLSLEKIEVTSGGKKNHLPRRCEQTARVADRLVLRFWGGH